MNATVGYKMGLFDEVDNSMPITVDAFKQLTTL